MRKTDPEAMPRYTNGFRFQASLWVRSIHDASHNEYIVVCPGHKTLFSSNGRFFPAVLGKRDGGRRILAFPVVTRVDLIGADAGSPCPWTQCRRAAQGILVGRKGMYGKCGTSEDSQAGRDGLE